MSVQNANGTIGKRHDEALSRVMIAVTFFFQPLRFTYLADALRTFAAYPIPVDVIVFVNNNIADHEEAMLRRICQQFMDAQYSIVRCRSHAHPFGMTWDHKEYIHNFLEDERYHYFIYAEDDIRIEYRTLQYFVENRDKLAAKGLIPGLVRIETRPSDGVAVSVDIYWRNIVSAQPHISFDAETIFVNPTHPYSAAYILDRSLAREYIASKSFTQDGSLLIKGDYGPAERSAMGLCFESIPDGFTSRFVVPVRASDLKVRLECCIAHLPNNYADQPGTIVAKIPLDQLFG